MEALKQLVQEAAPYFWVELLLPGGSVIALVLYLYRRSAAGARP